MAIPPGRVITGALTVVLFALSERRHTLRSTAIPSGRVIVGAVTILLFALCVGEANAGQFRVANCQADQLNFSTQAFTEFATRGMRIRRACNPEGPGMRGLITANTVNGGRVPRGSVARVAVDAPPGTRFTRFRWAGIIRRRDCRYSLRIYAIAPDLAKPIPIKNVRANQYCARGLVAQAARFPAFTFNVRGATRIVQSVVCVGGDGDESCSARGSNYIQTFKAEMGVVDTLAPSVGIIADTPLARGEWVSGTQPLNYDASDNVGVRSARAVIAGRNAGSLPRVCALASPDGAFANGVPCANGPGRIDVATNVLLEGTQNLIVQAEDTAGNSESSQAVTTRIDNGPPGRVDVSLAGGQEWRNRNDFAISWINPPETDRAPIAAAGYKLCGADGSCNRGDQAGPDIAGFGLPVPAPGEWTLSLWRRDAAGNETETAASVPVTLRYDPEPPQLGFELAAAGDPTHLSVQVTDAVSGLAGGSIEISRAGSSTWQALDTQIDGSRLVARVDDAALAAGTYLVRATARDQARNEASTDRRLDGQPMALTLPLRVASTMHAGVPHVRFVSRVVRRHGKRRHVRRRVTELRPAAAVRFNRRVRIAGRLVNPDGQGVADAEIQVLSRSSVSPEQLVAVLKTDGAGNYRYPAKGSMNRTLRFAFAGSALMLPAQREVKLSVSAASSLRVSRRRVLNGQAVTFAGRLRTPPVPRTGKLVELQVRLSDRWQTFRTQRTDSAGRWRIRYRFKRTRGLQRFRFRARLPREAAYPFDMGASRSLTVRVRGVA